MPHFYIPPENITGLNFSLTGTEIHHLVNVRRCKVGSIIQLFDGTGKTYLAKIEQINKTEIKGIILEEKKQISSSIKLNLYQSAPKGERFDWLVEKAAELGVNTLTPLITKRYSNKNIQINKINRWRRLSHAASQQSGRADLMYINEPAGFAKAISTIQSSAFSIIPWVGEESNTIQDIFNTHKSVHEANIFIGPEGGFTPEEIILAKNHGVIPVTMGQKILRVETAGLLATILVLNLAGEYLKTSSHDCHSRTP